MDNGKIRNEAWGLLRGGWFGRFFGYVVICVLIMLVVGKVLGWVYEQFMLQDVHGWMQESLKAMAVGLAEGNALELTPPTGAQLRGICYGTFFSEAVGFLFASLFVYGRTRMYLQAARAEEGPWLRHALSGFSDPWGILALRIRIWLQILGWSLLLVVPGICAAYRYALAWPLKVDHPDWTAGECLRESARRMDGRKLELFRLQASYWRIVTVYMLLIAYFTCAVPLVMLLPVSDLTRSLVLAPGIFLFLLWFMLSYAVGWYLGLGNVIFYRELSQDGRL